MLRFVITKADGTETAPENVLTAVLDSDMQVPADSLTVTCPFDSALRGSARQIRAFDGDRLLLWGNIDELSVIRESAGAVMKITARSPAAALLDCEAEPLVYNNPNAVLIAEKHLLPFGLAPAETDAVPCYSSFRIDKGMSHWQVVQSFCRSRYGSEPRVSGDGTVYLQGFLPKGSAVFSDYLPDEKAIRYDSLKEYDRRHRLISDVKVKFNPAGGYRSLIRNSNPGAARLQRTRYVNASINYSTLTNAYRILRNSNRDSYALTLECPCCCAPLLGMRAEVRDSILGTLGGLAVSKVRYTADSRGERSVITLRKENIDVVDELHNE